MDLLTNAIYAKETLLPMLFRAMGLLRTTCHSCVGPKAIGVLRQLRLLEWQERFMNFDLDLAIGDFGLTMKLRPSDLAGDAVNGTAKPRAAP